MAATSLKVYFIFLLPFVVSGIRISNIQVPSYHLSGKDLQLNCTYEQNQNKRDPLYSIKWYRGSDHFYEYTPIKRVQTKYFPFLGITVDLTRSRGSSIVLTNVDHKTSGRFRCEVMGDKPFFETESRNATMFVVDAPSINPSIFGVNHKAQIRVGEHLRVSCSVGESNPATNITWVINGIKEPVTKDSEKIHLTDSSGRDVIETSLDLLVRGDSFIKGTLEIECLAELFDVYKSSQKVLLLDIDRPQPAGFGWWFSSGSINIQPRFEMIYVLIIIYGYF